MLRQPAAKARHAAPFSRDSHAADGEILICGRYAFPMETQTGIVTTYRKHPRHRGRRHSSALRLVLNDMLLLGVLLTVFALFHHVIPIRLQAAGSSRTMPASSADAPSAPSVPAPDAPLQAPAPTSAIGDFSAAFPAQDTGAGALYSYQTDTVRIAIHKVCANGVTYFLADVYVKTIDALQTAFAQGAYGKSLYAFPAKTAADCGAVFAVTGDCYSARSKGIVVRNGRLYRDVPSDDVCVLYRNGEMKTYTDEPLDLTDFEGQDIWQAWSFGPALLNADGSAIDAFTSELKDRHPRCGIGYYAPGHYCLIVVDGRQEGYSVGMRLSEFSALFASLGCKQAYNLDGGQTATMIFRGEVVNRPYKGGRASGDIICFR